MPWQRPPSVPYPSVWGRCTGRKPMPDGQVPRFRIQDAPEHMFDQIVDHMASFYLKSEPFSVYSKMSEDPVSVAEAKAVWRAVLKNKLGLVAIVELPEGTEKLAGVNVTYISLIEEKDKKLELQGLAIQKMFAAAQQMAQLVDIFQLYGVDAYMAAYGLSVSPEYQGQGLGLEILKARVPLCKATGIKVTVSTFTATNSQEIARRAGFQLLAEVDYKDLKREGEEIFPGITVKKCKKMALKIE